MTNDKIQFTWKLWIKRAVWGLPLGVAAYLSGYFYGLPALIVSSIFALYIGHLYDLEWRKRIKFTI